MASMMIKINEKVDAFVLNIAKIEEATYDTRTVVMVQIVGGPEIEADCSKEEMKKRIDAAWEGR